MFFILGFLGGYLVNHFFGVKIATLFMAIKAKFSIPHF